MGENKKRKKGRINKKIRIITGRLKKGRLEVWKNGRKK
jgi:hypothetical protein